MPLARSRPSWKTGGGDPLPDPPISPATPPKKTRFPKDSAFGGGASHCVERLIRSGVPVHAAFFSFQD